jgi:hypothetical protein
MALMEILHQVSTIDSARKVFYRVPGHTGLPRSEVPDAAVKVAALYQDLTSDRVIDSDVCAIFFFS